MNRLTAAQIRAGPAGKNSDGLWLHRRRDGGGQWLLRVVVNGRRREMGLGSMRDVSLKDAREQRDHWWKVAAGGRDPIKERERARREAAAVRPSLEAVARETFEARKAQIKGEGKAGRWFSPVELHILPKLGSVRSRRSIRTTSIRRSCRSGTRRGRRPERRWAA